MTFNNNGGYSYVNGMNQNFSGGLSDTTVPSGPHTHGGVSNNVTAADSSTLSAMKGGSKGKGMRRTMKKGRKINKQKFKNISNMYKMSKSKLRSLKKTLRRKLMKGGSKCPMKGGTSSRKMGGGGKRSRRRRRTMRGGSTVSYGLDPLNRLSALANPMPFTRVDDGIYRSYNHFTGK
jgi:hypothetical protein